jgi:hypothetical protein
MMMTVFISLPHKITQNTEGPTSKTHKQHLGDFKDTLKVERPVIKFEKPYSVQERIFFS